MRDRGTRNTPQEESYFSDSEAKEIVLGGFRYFHV